MIQQTSILSYTELKPKLGEKQETVYKEIANHPKGVSNRELSLKLNLPINSITGRTNELVKKLLVTIKKVDYDPITHRKVIKWTIF